MSIDSDDFRRLIAAMDRAFISPNVADSNGEPANMVDALSQIGTSIDTHGDGVERGLNAVAEAIERLAEAVEAKGKGG